MRQGLLDPLSCAACKKGARRTGCASRSAVQRGSAQQQAALPQAAAPHALHTPSRKVSLGASGVRMMPARRSDRPLWQRESVGRAGL